MKIQMQAVHFSADQKLLDFIEKKLNKLDHYFGKTCKTFETAIDRAIPLLKRQLIKFKEVKSQN